MRKLLLGSTAVAAAALFAPGGAMAQSLSGDAFSSSIGAPSTSLRGLEVRIGGYYKAMYNYTRQDNVNTGTARLGSSDFSNEIEIHVLASGKAANGLRYGVALEIQNDSVRNTSAGSKNTLDYDEAWAYLAGPWGQIRFGDEDGAIGQLQSGHITGFGLGGLDSGDLNQQVVGGNYRMNLMGPNDLGDNTKLIYLTPQFFGFDAGVSFAFNNQEGALSGCDSIDTVTACDRLSAVAGGSTRRRNEIQAALRWRGSFGPVGLAATVGYIGADAVKNITGNSGERIDMLWAGAVATAYGFSVGGWYTGGTNNGNFTTVTRAGGTIRDDRRSDAFLVGATYTIDAITVGGHFSTNWSAGSQTAPAGRRDLGWSVGGNYRVAPGLDFFAEYNRVERKERGVQLTNSGPAGKADTDVVLAGFRVAF
ncbi:Outer membrane protein (porin) [Roseomonas rosea]|uniref:Outer membrane protein (Porin) n=1 Tax=Muricoccus roseus TaxID=198092 RepID=A0A1M6FQB1_9PROT|nr:porin [Roseomonas rosea]SHI99856.1 Outer membrane protein (porin) [Roseomonas rosea]